MVRFLEVVVGGSVIATLILGLIIALLIRKFKKEQGPMPKRYGGFGSSISGSAGS